MAMLSSVAAASGQIFIVEFVAFCCRFFLYHETLSELPSKRIKAFAFGFHLSMLPHPIGQRMV